MQQFSKDVDTWIVQTFGTRTLIVLRTIAIVFAIVSFFVAVIMTLAYIDANWGEHGLERFFLGIFTLFGLIALVGFTFDWMSNKVQEEFPLQDKQEYDPYDNNDVQSFDETDPGDILGEVESILNSSKGKK